MLIDNTDYVSYLDFFRRAKQTIAMIRMRTNIPPIAAPITADVGREEDPDVDIWSCPPGTEETVDWPAKKKISKHVNEIWNSYHHPTGIWLGTNMATEESQCYINI